MTDMSGNDHAISFRTAIGGYNKTDVNNYIEKMHRNFSAESGKMKQEIVNLKGQLEKVPVGTPAEEKKPDLSAANAHLRAQIEALEAELHEAKAARDEALKAAETAKAEAAASSKQAPAADNPDTEKNKIYEEMSSRLGNVLLIANENADKMVTDAKTESSAILKKAQEDAIRIVATAEAKSDQIIENANAEADKLRRETAEKAAAVSESVNGQLREASERYIREYSDLFESLASEIEKIDSGLRDKSGKIERDLAGMKADIGKNLEEELDKIAKTEIRSV